MKVQLFHFSRVRVRGPMGVYEEERMRPAGGGAISHNGECFQPDAQGWVEIPLSVYRALKEVRHRRPEGGYTRYVTPADIDEPEFLGLVDQPEAPSAAKRGPKARAAST